LKIGLLTVPFRDRSLTEALAFAREAGFECVEIACPVHLDPMRITDEEVRALRGALGDLSISSLACYANPLDPDPQRRAATIAGLEAAIDRAPDLGTDVVCTLAGMPLPGKTKEQTIAEDAPGVFGPLLQRAAARGVKIALENYFPTLIGNMVQWEAIFNAIPNPNFGLNFDPSHLVWQDIDPIAAVDRFADRIFHTHAKDVEIRWDKRRWIGNQERGWWRYVIPGRGDIAWGSFYGALARNGFDGAVSIEHEDGTLGAEEGFLLGHHFLSTVVA
jgi:sugar phosphate isomerase/epimerase